MAQATMPIEVRKVQTLAAGAHMSQKTKNFITQYQARYHVDVSKNDSPVDAAAQAYDLVSLLAKGVESCDDLAPDSILQALEQITRHEGVLKLYSPPFTRQRHDALNEDDLDVVIISE